MSIARQLKRQKLRGSRGVSKSAIHRLATYHEVLDGGSDYLESGIGMRRAPTGTEKLPDAKMAKLSDFGWNQNAKVETLGHRRITMKIARPILGKMRDEPPTGKTEIIEETLRRYERRQVKLSALIGPAPEPVAGQVRTRVRNDSLDA